MMKLEQLVRDKIISMGGRMYEISVSETDGIPQYLIILPGGHIGFVEFTEPDTQVRIHTRRRLQELRTLGCAACAMDKEEQINRLIMYILSDAGKAPSWNAYRDHLMAAGTKEVMLDEI